MIAAFYDQTPTQLFVGLATQHLDAQAIAEQLRLANQPPELAAHEGPRAEG